MRKPLSSLGHLALGLFLVLMASLPTPGVLWAMSSGDNSSESAIPLPQETFTVLGRDVQNNTLEVKRFTLAGKVYFQGMLGQATLTVPFAKVASVRFSPPALGEATTVRAEITLRTGEKVNLRMDGALKAYGATQYGNYEIYLRDVSSLEFR